MNTIYINCNHDVYSKKLKFIILIVLRIYAFTSTLQLYQTYIEMLEVKLKFV